MTPALEAALASRAETRAQIARATDSEHLTWLRENGFFEKPASPASNQKAATCRRCGGAIRFRQLPNGKLAPINDNDGKFHKQRCKVALWHRKGDPDISPPFVTNPINVTTYQGSTPPWAFDKWAWIDPADEARKQKWLIENGYLEPLLVKVA